MFDVVVIRGRELLVGIALLVLGSQLAAAQSLALSPDGKLVAYQRGDVLWLASVPSNGKSIQIATVPPQLSLPRWSPKGDQLAYYSEESGSLQLWLYDVRAKLTRQVSVVEGGVDPNSLARFGGWIGDPLRYSWSPDGLTIAFSTQVSIGPTETLNRPAIPPFPSSQDQAAGKPIILTRDTPPEWTLHGVVSYGHPSNRTFSEGGANSKDAPRIVPSRTTQIFLLDVRTGKAAQITSGDDGYFTPEWSPDGVHVAFMSPGGQSLLGWGPTETDIYVIDLATGDRRRLTSGPAQKTLPRWSPDGRLISFYWRDITGTTSRKEEGVSVIASSGERIVAVLGNDLDRHITDYEWASDGKGILMTYWDGLYRPLIRAPLVPGTVAEISPATALVDGLATSGGGLLWSQITDPNSPRMLWFASSKGQAYAVTQIEGGRDLRHQRRYEVVKWSNGRGEKIEGILIYPLHFVAGRSYPLVVDAYGAGTIDPWPDNLNFVKASPDYLYFRPNHRAPHMWMNPLKGSRYTAAAVGRDGIAVMVDDMLSGVDTLIARGIADANRMCLVGFSNGGLEGEQVLTKTKRFKCAIFQSPSTSDWLSHFFLSSGDRETIRFMNGVEPWSDPSLYTALSPLYHADKITTPILFAVGDQESVVLQTVEMYNALRFLKKEVTLLRYSGQGHGFSGAAEADFQNRITSFLSAYLDPKPSSELTTSSSD